MTDVLDRPDTGGKLKVVGTRPDRPDGVDKVTGRATYGADFAMAFRSDLSGVRGL